MSEIGLSNIFDITWDVLDACNGFALDMGASSLKMVYIDKTLWKEPSKRTKGSKGKLLIKTFTHGQLEDGRVYQFIRDNVHIVRDQGGEPPVIYGTGFWIYVNGGQINKELNVSMKNSHETYCFINALRYMFVNGPKKDVVEKGNLDLIKSCREENEQALFRKLPKESWTGESVPEVEDLSPWFPEGLCNPDDPFSPDIYPCTLATCGSGWGVFSVDENRFQTITISRRSGQMWLGLGSLLTGGSDYTELMAMAEMGDYTTVDLCNNDLLMNEQTHLKDDNSVYKEYVEFVKTQKKGRNASLFAFGKAANKKITDFKKEDLATAFLQSMVSDLVQVAHDAARIKKSKHMFFTGGFIDNQLVRDMLYREWKMRDCETRFFGMSEPIECHFIKNGQHYGALGALLNSISPKDKSTN